MKKVKLIDICKPKQWATISTDKLLRDGYPVYGANGRIGYYDKYNHQYPTLLITCRGATCGTINISEPKSYINGNAMCLDDLHPDILLKYLYYQLLNYNFKEVISGSAQPQITREGLAKVWLNIHSLEEQKAIAERLDKVSGLIEKRKTQLEKLDLLIKSRFIEMFGEPESNPTHWDMLPLENCLTVLGGYAFKSEEFKTSGVPVLRIGNINTGVFTPTNLVYWTKDASLERYQVLPGDLVISLTGTVGKDDYGNVCILGNAYTMYYLNQRNAKLILGESLNKHYLSELLKFSQIKKKLTGISRGVRQANISNRDILNLVVPIPPIELQTQFSAFVEQTDKSKFEIQKSLEKLEILKKSLMQQYFG